MNNIWKRIRCFALVLAIGCTLLPVQALAAENTYTIEIPDGEITAAALYAAIVALDPSFEPKKTTTGRLIAATAGINVADSFEFGDRPGGGVKYVDGSNAYVAAANSEGNAAVSHNVLYSIHSFLLSGNAVSNVTCDYFDTGKYVRMMFYYEPVIESVIAQDAKGDAIALPAGASAKLTDHDGGKFYRNDKATISAAPVDGFEVYAGSSKLAYNEATGMYELEVTITDSSAYTVIYKKKEAEIANVTYTEIRTDAAGNVTTGISGMVTGATSSAVYAVGDSLTYMAAPIGNWYVKSMKINNTEQPHAAAFDQNRACEVSYEITGAGAVDVTVELAEKYLTAKSGVQNVLFNPAKTVAQQMKANGTVYGTNPLEKLIFEAVIASGSKGNLPAALSWDSSGISYAFKSDAAWQPLDFAGDEYHHAFPTEIGAAAEIQITWAGDRQYPAVSATGTVMLADCRAPAPAYDISVDSETEIGDIQAAVATAAAALGLTADRFQVPQNMQSQIDEMPAGTKKTFTLVAAFDGNADYRPGQVKVSVEVTKAAILPATVTLPADAGKGTVTIKNASGRDVDLNNVYAADSPLIVHVTPKTSENAANYVQHIIVTEDGQEILKTEAGVNTATFSVRNSKTAHHYEVTVSYGFYELKLADTIAPVKFNPFVAVADQMTGGQAEADAANERMLEQSILDALRICYNGEKLEYSDRVTITYHPWELCLEDEATYRYAENTDVRPALDGRVEDTDDSVFFGFGERWVDAQTKTLTGACKEKVTIAYEGLSVTAEITLEEGRPVLTLSGGVSDTIVKINSMDDQADRNAVNQAAMSVVIGSKPPETPRYTYANTENLNKLTPTDIQVTIHYDATADHKDAAVEVTVPVQLMERPSTVTVAEKGEAGSGTVRICDAAGDEVTSTDAGILRLQIDPDDDGSYVADCEVTDQDGNQIPLAGAFSNTNYEGTFEIACDNAYTATVTYAKRTLTAAGNVLDYNRFYDGKVTQYTGEVKAALIGNVLAATGGTMQAKDLEVRIWVDDAGKYDNIDGSCEEGQQANLADAAFTGDKVKLQIIWVGDDRYPSVTLTDLEMTLRDTRPAVRAETKAYDPDGEPVILKDSDEENRKLLNGKALGMVAINAFHGSNAKPEVDICPPSAYLYAVDVTEANAQTPFTTDLVIPKDRQDHIVAVKISWDSTAEYIGTESVVYVTVNCTDDSSPNSGMYKLVMDPAESTAIVPGAEIFVGGEPYLLDENCTAWINPHAVEDAAFVTSYRYNTAGTAYGAYPTHMYVWYAVPADSDSDGENDSFDVCRTAQLDDFFRYEGTSIHVGRSIGDIRFFTSVHRETCEKLMQGTLLTGALKGYRMTQAGTVFGKYSEESTTVTLGNGVCSDVYGGKAGKTFRVFSKNGQRNWFTGMLTGLDKDAATIHTNILSRPYAVLECGGQSVTLYGAAVQRSLYYVAAQNRDAFPANSASDKLIESLIAAGVDDIMP